MRTVLLSIFVLISLVLSFNNLNGQKPIGPLLDSLELTLSKARGVGAMVCIVTKDSILFTGGIGYADQDAKTPVTDQHLFRLGSISKSFTAIALLHLLEKNNYSLETPVKSILPNIPIDNPWSNTHPVMIAHLLEHTAGFDDLHMYAWGITDTVQPSAMRQVELARKSLKVRWQPGTKFSYSNPGYLVAGLLIETLAGEPYADYIQQNLLAPLGMNASGFYFNEPTYLPTSTGYHNEGGVFSSRDFQRVNAGAAGDLMSNAADMAKYLQFVLNKEITNDTTKIIPSTDFDRIEIPKYNKAIHQGINKGYGLGNGNSWRNGFEFHGHNGGIPGFSSNYIYSREANIGIAVSVNANGFPNDIINKILDYYITTEDEDPFNKSRTKISEEIIKEYSGFYHYKNHRNQLLAFVQNMVDGRELVITTDSIATYDFWGSPFSTYYHDRDNLFFKKGEGINSFALFQDDGQAVFWQRSDYAQKTNKALVTIEFIFAIVSLVLTILFFIYGIIQAMVNLISDKRRFTPSFTSIWLTSISFIVGAFSFVFSNLSTDKTVPGVMNITFMIATVAFFILSIVAVVIYFKKKPIGLTPKIYYALSALSMIGLSIYLLSNGIIGLRLWDY